MSTKTSSFNRILMAVIGVIVVGVLVVVVSSARRAAHTAAAVGLAQPDTTALPDWSDVMVETADGTESLPKITSVAMIVSSTCIHCHKMLAAMGKAHAGPHLVIVTLQGRAAGDSLIKASGLDAINAAPTPNPQAWVGQTGVQSVPTFLWFDNSGHIKAAQLGEVNDSVVAVWAARTH